MIESILIHLLTLSVLEVFHIQTSRLELMLLYLIVESKSVSDDLTYLQHPVLSPVDRQSECSPTQLALWKYADFDLSYEIGGQSKRNSQEKTIYGPFKN